MHLYLLFPSYHRKICETCKKNNWKQPSYYQVYTISKSLSPSLKKLAYEGKKEYQNNYDLIHRREANYSNEIWQADDIQGKIREQ